MRTFLAIGLPEEAGSIVEQVQRALRDLPGIRLARPQTCHLTLKFLGEIEEPRLALLLPALREIRQAPFSLSLTGLGAFPDGRRPRVIWLGVAGSRHLEALAAAVDRATQAIALDKAFFPHITIARIKGPGAIARSDLMAAVPACSFAVDEFLLYESVSTPQGVRYLCREKFPLRG